MANSNHKKFLQRQVKVFLSYLDKVLLEAELLELKANPEKNATGTVIEASLDKGKGYLTTILVEAGTLS